MSAIQAARARGRPVKPMDSDRNAAPARMRATIAEVRVAPIRLSPKVFQVSEPCPAASASEPMTPRAAGFGGGGKAGIHRPDHDDDQHDHRQQERELASFSRKVICGSGCGL